KRRAAPSASSGSGGDGRVATGILNMKRAIRSLGLATLVAGTAFANAQQIYEPNQSIQSQGISVTGWGSGAISETDELAVSGANSIRVSSRNFFQGGIIRFQKPIDLTQTYND